MEIGLKSETIDETGSLFHGQTMAFLPFSKLSGIWNFEEKNYTCVREQEKWQEGII